MNIGANVNQVMERVAGACARVGRAPGSVTVIAVSKGHSAEAIRRAAEAGLEIFGESKVQEAKLKIGQCPGRLHWHMIGHLQSNKVRDAVRLFEMIQSVDSYALAEEINDCGEKQAKSVPVLLEVNVAGEGSKFGFAPDQIVDELMRINELPRVEIHGLMTIAPWKSEAERVRPYFRHLRELKSEAEDKLGAPLPHLSMGMSGDFEVAIEEGATMVRLGTILFGPRRTVIRAGAD